MIFILCAVGNMKPAPSCPMLPLASFSFAPGASSAGSCALIVSLSPSLPLTPCCGGREQHYILISLAWWRMQVSERQHFLVTWTHWGWINHMPIDMARAEWLTWIVTVVLGQKAPLRAPTPPPELNRRSACRWHKARSPHRHWDVDTNAHKSFWYDIAVILMQISQMMLLSFNYALTKWANSILYTTYIYCL